MPQAAADLTGPVSDVMEQPVGAPARDRFMNAAMPSANTIPSAAWPAAAFADRLEWAQAHDAWDADRRATVTPGEAPAPTSLDP